jgi:hypothetical protein
VVADNQGLDKSENTRMMNHDYVRHVNEGIKNEYVLQCWYRSSSNVAQHNDFYFGISLKGEVTKVRGFSYHPL